MPRLIRLLPALGAFFVFAIALAACGDSVPGNAVAKVDGDTIKTSEFDHWMRIAAISTQGGQGGKVSIPKPPDFKECVANAQKNAPKPAKGQPVPTAAQFKTQCKAQYDSLRDQVMQFLLQAAWIQGETKDQGIKVSDKEVETKFQQTKKQSFPKAADFTRFLKDSGMTLDDIHFRVRLDALSQKLQTKVTGKKPAITDAAVAKYYNDNKKSFAMPERRDLRIVLTKTEDKAVAAKTELQNGASWKAIVNKYSIDTASKAQGGVLLNVPKGQQERALDTAVFGAAKGALQGPIKTQFGYYVFQVQKITPAGQQSQKEASPAIRQLLQAQQQQKGVDTFVKDFRSKWKGKTNCRSGYVTQDCKNAPKQTTTALPSTQVPQGSQPAPSTT